MEEVSGGAGPAVAMAALPEPALARTLVDRMGRPLRERVSVTDRCNFR